MKSVMAESLNLSYEPVALVLADEKPDGAKQFKPGKWGCIMFMLAAATRGQTTAFDRESYGCQGGGVGLGFGNQYKAFPGGEDGFCYFLSIGNQEWEQGRQVAEQVKPYLDPKAHDDFVHGERYIQTPAKVRRFIDNLPMTDVPTNYVLFKPLKAVDPAAETPAVVIFLADMDQMAALTILANYHRDNNENVIVPYAAGCQSIGIYPMAEAKSGSPRAVLGMMDISARVSLKRMLKQDLVTFAMPHQLYQEMEQNVPGSFLERNTWRELIALKPQN